MIPDISIILPCRNEVKFIDACVRSVLAQELHGWAVEVIIADGMSDDGTRERLAEWQNRDRRIVLIDNPGKVTPKALNAAIRVSRAPVIIRLDCHSTYPPDYIRNCVEALLKSGADNAGGLFVTHARGDTLSALMVQAISTHKFGVGDAKFRTGSIAGFVDTVPFGCFRRELFDQIGLFDERLTRHQDYEMNARIRASGGRIWLDPSIRINYFNQPNVRGLLRQAFIAGRSNVYSWHLAPYSFRLRHVVPGLFVLFLLGGLILSPLSIVIAASYLATVALYFLLAVISSVQQARLLQRPLLIVTLPATFLAYHFWFGIGIWRGAFDVISGHTPYNQYSLPWSGARKFRLSPSQSTKDAPVNGQESKHAQKIV